MSWGEWKLIFKVTLRTSYRLLPSAFLLGAAGLLCLTASPAAADFCGAKEDPFVCTARLQTGPPSPGEVAFLNVVGPHVPVSPQQLLVAGRTVCNQGGLSLSYVVSELNSFLGLRDMNSAAEVLFEAHESMCPGVAFG
jgi:hypothetical protein